MNVIHLIWIHFLSDFVLQSDKMAKNKSSSMKWLSIHIFVYGLPFIAVGIKFAIFNSLAHFVVDFFTSRLTSYLWKKQEIHYFFVIIGLDQAIHLSLLFLSFEWFK